MKKTTLALIGLAALVLAGAAPTPGRAGTVPSSDTLDEIFHGMGDLNGRFPLASIPEVPDETTALVTVRKLVIDLIEADGSRSDRFTIQSFGIAITSDFTQNGVEEPLEPRPDAIAVHAESLVPFSLTIASDKSDSAKTAPSDTITLSVFGSRAKVLTLAETDEQGGGILTGDIGPIKFDLYENATEVSDYFDLGLVQFDLLSDEDPGGINPGPVGPGVLHLAYREEGPPVSYSMVFVSDVPEPATLGLLGLGVACLGAFGWRRNRAGGRHRPSSNA
jgi:hypothetical protein